MKKLITLLFFLLPVFLIRPAFAADLSILCTNSGCQKSSDFPLFSETNIYPGFTTNSNLDVGNSRDENCNLTFTAKNNSKLISSLSEQIDINIINGTDTWYKGSLYDLLLQGEYDYKSLGTIPKFSRKKYVWSASFSPDAGNEFQNTNTNFDLKINFSCNGPSDVKSLSTSTTNSSSKTCNNSVPTAPTNFSATTNDTGSVTLSWKHSSSPYTHYLVAYGTKPGEYLYGNPNVGNDDHYTVRSLTPGAQYCFYVRTINDCMPGDKTKEICVNTGSTITANTIPPTGFETGVLGATTENPTSAPGSNKNILGADTNCTHHWLPILFIAAFFINLIYLKFLRKYKITPFLISLIAFLIDQYILRSRCCFGPNWFCNYFWIGNILSWILPISINFKKVK